MVSNSYFFFTSNFTNKANSTMNFFTLLAILLGFSFCSLFVNNGPVVVQALHKFYPKLQSIENDNDTEIKQLHRTGFHFQPHRHWMNGL